MSFKRLICFTLLCRYRLIQPHLFVSTRKFRLELDQLF
jgi:hypothetical protein